MAAGTSLRLSRSVGALSGVTVAPCVTRWKSPRWWSPALRRAGDAARTSVRSRGGAFRLLRRPRPAIDVFLEPFDARGKADLAELATVLLECEHVFLKPVKAGEQPSKIHFGAVLQGERGLDRLAVDAELPGASSGDRRISILAYG